MRYVIRGNQSKEQVELLKDWLAANEFHNTIVTGDGTE